MFNPIPILGLIPNLLGYWQKKKEMQLRWFELIASVLIDVVKFIWANIKIICIGLILAYCLIKYNASVRYGISEYKQKIIAQKALNDHVEADSAAAKKREAENKLNAILAQKKTAADKLAYEQKLKTANLDRDTLKKELNNEKANIRRIIANARQLRDSKGSTASTGLPTIPLSTDLFASGSDYNAIVTLDESCQVTTQDYNELMRKWLDHCKIYKCIKLEELK